MKPFQYFKLNFNLQNHFHSTLKSLKKLYKFINFNLSFCNCPQRLHFLSVLTISVLKRRKVLFEQKSHKTNSLSISFGKQSFLRFECVKVPWFFFHFHLSPHFFQPHNVEATNWLNYNCANKFERRNRTVCFAEETFPFLPFTDAVCHGLVILLKRFRRRSPSLRVFSMIELIPELFCSLAFEVFSKWREINRWSVEARGWIHRNWSFKEKLLMFQSFLNF